MPCAPTVIYAAIEVVDRSSIFLVERCIDSDVDCLLGARLLLLSAVGLRRYDAHLQGLSICLPTTFCSTPDCDMPSAVVLTASPLDCLTLAAAVARFFASTRRTDPLDLTAVCSLMLTTSFFLFALSICVDMTSV